MIKSINRNVYNPPIVEVNKYSDENCFNCFYCEYKFNQDEIPDKTCLYYACHPEVTDDSWCIMHKQLINFDHLI